MDASRQRLRQLPKIDALVAEAQLVGEGAPEWALKNAARQLVESARGAILAGHEPGPFGPEAVVRAARELSRMPLRRVVNGTGVVLHTNLGRAPLAAEVVRATEIAGGYCNLELDLATGRRGSRHDHAGELLRQVCGAEDACVVNNNAGAVMLALAGIAAGREVVVSRGELVEIGGSFRIPDVMQLSRATLVEVGTTNKTRVADYAGAIGERTALLLKVHQANFAIVGFTAEVAPAELAALGAERGVPTMMDLGSGALLSTGELSDLGLAGEPTVADTLAAGIDLVCFSCDKLLGGPQAGVIAGRRELVQAARSHPLMRALRPDKLTLATLCATLDLYRRGEEDAIPAVAMLRAQAGALRRRAETLLARVGDAHDISVDLIACESTAGGGAKPTASLPSWGLAIGGRGADDIAAALRAGDPPILARIEDERVIIDVRCLFESELDVVADAIRGLGGDRE